MLACTFFVSAELRWPSKPDNKIDRRVTWHKKCVRVWKGDAIKYQKKWNFRLLIKSSFFWSQFPPPSRSPSTSSGILKQCSRYEPCRKTQESLWCWPIRRAVKNKKKNHINKVCKYQLIRATHRVSQVSSHSVLELSVRQLILLFPRIWYDIEDIKKEMLKHPKSKQGNSQFFVLDISFFFRHSFFFILYLHFFMLCVWLLTRLQLWNWRRSRSGWGGGGGGEGGKRTQQHKTEKLLSSSHAPSIVMPLTLSKEPADWLLWVSCIDPSSSGRVRQK